MNIFRKFTLRSLRRNRARTIVTIVGIILSVAMITAVTTTISSIQQFMLDVTIQNDGAWHVAVENISDQQAKEIADRGEVDGYAALKNVGYAKLEKSRNKEKQYLYIGAYEGAFVDQLSVFPVEGRLPRNSSEIVLPTSLTSNGGIKYEVGDTLSLPVGTRKTTEQKLLWQSDSEEELTGKETFVEQGKKVYKVVGVYESATFDGNHSSAGYPALTVVEDNQKDFGVNLYVTLKEPKTVGSFMKELNVQDDSALLASSDVRSNKYYLIYAGYSTNKNVSSVLQGLMLILIGIIMFGSISLIGNSFSISVNERKKQYGLLSSIGATRRQLKRSVLFEAVSLSVVGIPLGVLAGIGGMSVTFYFVNDLLIQSIHAGLKAGGSQLRLHMVAAGWAILLATVIGFITILISAYLPARKALKVSSIEAIRQTTDIKIRPRQIRTSKLTRRLFGIEGVLAAKNFKRNRRKYRATVFSLFISIVLFISATSFCDYMATGVQTMVTEYDYDIRYSIKETEGASLLYQNMSQIKDVTKAGYYFNTSGEEDVLFIAVQKDCISEKYRESGSLSEAMDDEQKRIVPHQSQMLENVRVLFIEDKLYRQYLRSQKLDVADYINGKDSKAVIVDTITAKGQDNVFEQYHAFQSVPNKVTLCCPKKDKTYETTTGICGTIVEEAPYGISTGYDIVLCYPESAMAELCPKSAIRDRVMSFKSDNPMQTYQLMSDLLEENGQATDGLVNIADEVQSTRALLVVMRIFSYGFIILISLIAMANVFNTISTNISLRKREFAMLKSIGMTNRSFHKMMDYECILYGCKGLLFGLPVAIVVTWFIYRAVGEGVVLNFYVPWYSVTIAIASVFVVVFATMLYATHKLRKDHVVETLKNENY